MIRSTWVLRLRMPNTRRPRERPWEIFNSRDFGYQEGSQNYYTWALVACFPTGLLFFEMYQQSKRILARGDSCPACEAARAHYQMRVEAREKETQAINSASRAAGGA